MSFEDRLRRALHDRAASVEPDEQAGLDRISDRVFAEGGDMDINFRSPRTRWVLTAAAAALVLVVVGAGVLLGGDDNQDNVGIADDGATTSTEQATAPTQAQVPVDGCERPPSVRRARERASGPPFATIMRSLFPTPFSELVDGSTSLVIGEIVDVRQGAIDEQDRSDSLPEGAEDLPNSEGSFFHPMANVIILVEEVYGSPGGVHPGDRVAVPLAVGSFSPPPSQFPDEVEATHVDGVHHLNCAMPRLHAAAFVADVGPTTGDARLTRMPTIMGIPDPAAMILEQPAGGLASLDTLAPRGEPSAYGGAASLIELGQTVEPLLDR